MEYDDDDDEDNASEVIPKLSELAKDLDYDSKVLRFNCLLCENSECFDSEEGGRLCPNAIKVGIFFLTD